MEAILEFFRLEDAVPLALLAFLLRVIGSQAAGERPSIRRLAKGCSVAAFLLYCVCAIAVWKPATASGFLKVGVQALFALGITHGLSLIALSVLRVLYLHLWEGAQARALAQDQERARRRAGEEEKREIAARERALEEERKRLAPYLEQQREQAQQEADNMNHDRRQRVARARSEVVTFYDAHAAELHDGLPPALFRSRLENRFPDHLAPEEAWKAAQEMITEMLPLIAQAREKQRAEQEEKRQRCEAEEKKPATLYDLVAWYQRQKQALDALPPEIDKEVPLLKLHERYDQLLKELLEKLQP